MHIMKLSSNVNLFHEKMKIMNFIDGRKKRVEQKET